MENLKKYLRNLSNIKENKDKLSYLVNVLHQNRYLNVYNTEENLVKITLNKQNSKFPDDPFYRIADGLLIDPKTSKILSIPRFNIVNNFGMIKKEISKDTTKVYSLKNGTVITLYFYKKQWRISTRGSANANNHIWFGVKYLDALNEIFKHFEISWDSFNTSCCYSLGFTHPSMHLLESEFDLWFINAYDLDKFNTTYDIYEYMTADTICKNNEYSKVFKMNEIIKKDLQVMQESNSNSVKWYTLYKRKHYGYLVETSNNSYFCKSLLQNTLNKYVYDIKIDFNKDRMKFLKIYNWLLTKKDKNNVFIDLFPTHKDEFKEYDTKIVDIIDKVKNNNPSDSDNIHIRHIAQKMEECIYESSKDKAMISDFIFDIRHTDILYELL